MYIKRRPNIQESFPIPFVFVALSQTSVTNLVSNYTYGCVSLFPQGPFTVYMPLMNTKYLRAVVTYKGH